VVEGQVAVAALTVVVVAGLALEEEEGKYAHVERDLKR